MDGITIVVNGQGQSCPPCSVLELIERRKLSRRALVVELNGAILTDEQWPMIQLKDDDVLELLTFVGGG